CRMAARGAREATGGAAMKKRGRETTKLKGRNALPVSRHRGPTAADLQKQLNQRTRELADAQKHLAEALEQQAATSDVLQIISSSPGNLRPVFETILANATRLCGARSGTLYVCEGEDLRIVAMHNAPLAYAKARPVGALIRPGSPSAIGRVIRTKQPVHIADVRAENAYAKRDPMRVAAVELAGARTVLVVPMLKEKELIGAIGIYRQFVSSRWEAPLDRLDRRRISCISWNSI